MKKQLDALSELLDDQFSDWSDIEYDFDEPTKNAKGVVSVDVTIERPCYGKAFTIPFEVKEDLSVWLNLHDSSFYEADSKWFWIIIAPKLF